MSTITRTTPQRIDVLHPLVASIVGALAFAAAITAGEVFDLNSNAADASATTVTDILTYAGLVLAAAALATWVGIRARTGSPDRLARFALGLALASALTFVVFWSGWPQVLGAVALASSFEHRRRIGSFSPTSAIVATIGGLALLGSTVTCVVG